MHSEKLQCRYDSVHSVHPLSCAIIWYDTIGEFNVDSKAEYSALSSTRSQKKKLKQNNASAPLISKNIVFSACMDMV